jgi:hypothetical protein
MQPRQDGTIARIPPGALIVRDVLDGQLLARGGVRIARVADVELRRAADGSLRATALVIGPEALAGRIADGFRRLLHGVLRGRFEHAIPLEEVLEVGPWLRLRGSSDEYDTGSGDRWFGDRLLRFIPGSGHAAPVRRRRRGRGGRRA